MSEIAPSFAAELNDEHASLLRQLGCLEEGPGPWKSVPIGILIVRLREVQASLLRHFRFEEQGGYMSQVLADAPHLYHAAQELLAEHGRMSADLEALITSAAGVPPEGLVTPQLRAQVSQWMLRVRGHESRETQLIQRACNEDIGADD